MSEFLKNLNEALAGKVFIEAPIFIESKIGTFHPHPIRGMVSELKQFSVTPYEVNEGPGIKINTGKIKTEFTIEHIRQLTELIVNYSKKISFVQLILPSVEKAYLERHKNIIGRYLEDHISTTDELLKRWDFLIQKLD